MDNPRETAVADAAPVSTGMSTTRWVLIAAVAIALVLFIAWARREPGFDDRVPDPEDAVAAFVVNVDRGPDGGGA